MTASTILSTEDLGNGRFVLQSFQGRLGLAWFILDTATLVKAGLDKGLPEVVAQADTREEALAQLERHHAKVAQRLASGTVPTETRRQFLELPVRSQLLGLAVMAKAGGEQRVLDDLLERHASLDKAA